jgi:hypothetical protein
MSTLDPAKDGTLKTFRKWLYFMIGLIVYIFVLVLVLLKILGGYCSNQNNPPSYPIFPRASLVDEKANGVGNSDRPLLTRYYQINSTPEQIILFYTQYASCNPSVDESHMLCVGSAARSGEYIVYIPSSPDLNTHLVEFVVEVRWDGCPVN